VRRVVALDRCGVGAARIIGAAGNRHRFATEPAGAPLTTRVASSGKYRP
jgi:hypothetical protein